jgi:hypothetical protein
LLSQTCFGWFKPTYNANEVVLGNVPVTSASFRSDQKNDTTFGNVLTSGMFALSEMAVKPFLKIGNSQNNTR